MSMLGLSAVVTGGAQGIGKAVAKALLKEQCKVIICDIAEIQAEQFVNEMKDDFGEDSCHFIKCDVRDTDALEKMLEDAKAQNGRLDIVFNNAGIFSKDTNDARNLIVTNLVHTVVSTYKAIELMSVKNGGNGGVVVNHSSFAGLKIEKVSAFYTASETGIVNFTRAFGLWPYAQDDKVRVNCLCPSNVDTDNAKEAWKRRSSSETHVKATGTCDMDAVVKAFMDCAKGEMNAKVLAVFPPNSIAEA